MKSWGETAFAIPIFHPEVPMAKQHPNHESFEEVKFVSPFISPKPTSHLCEMEHSSSPSLEHKPCPSAHLNENFYAIDISKVTLGTK